MTQSQFEAAMVKVSLNIGNIGPIMKKFAKRYQASMRRNLRAGKNADGSPMEPLSRLTMQGNITTRGGGRGPKRSSFGSKPLQATGEMVRAFKAVGDAKGWIAYVTDDYKRKISFWQANVPSGETLTIKPRQDKSGKAMSRALGRKGMPISPSMAAHGLRRPARLPFALNSRQVKRSVTDLNKFILKPFLS